MLTLPQHTCGLANLMASSAKLVRPAIEAEPCQLLNYWCYGAVQDCESWSCFY